MSASLAPRCSTRAPRIGPDGAPGPSARRSGARSGRSQTNSLPRTSQRSWPRDSRSLVALHWKVILGLGTVWILDGLEVTIVGSISGQIGQKGAGVGISTAGVSGLTASLYVAGALRRRARVRSAHRPLWAQEAVHDHARHVSGGDDPHRHHPHRGAHRDLLLRLGGRQLRLPDGVGDLPHGDPGDVISVLAEGRGLEDIAEPPTAAESSRRGATVPATA
jgi:hypothetical protein